MNGDSRWKTVIWGKFSWWRVIRLPFIIYTVLLIVGGLFPYKFIFPYSGCSYNESLEGLEMITSSDGNEIATLYHKARDEKFIALFFHGNAEDIGQLFDIKYQLHRKNISLLAMDYPGYGMSTGTPTEESCWAAGKALYQKALELGYTNDQILFWGRSVGSGIATPLAHWFPVRALVLESPFASAFTVKTRVQIVPFDKFDNLSRMESMKTPLFIIHGENDKLIHPRHSEHLFNTHQGKKQLTIIPEAGHNNIWIQDLESTFHNLMAFLEN